MMAGCTGSMRYILYTLVGIIGVAMLIFFPIIFFDRFLHGDDTILCSNTGKGAGCSSNLGMALTIMAADIALLGALVYSIVTQFCRKPDRKDPE